MFRQRQHFRHSDATRFRSTTPFAERARRRLGLFLVGTGSRLLTKGSSEVDRLDRSGVYVAR